MKKIITAIMVLLCWVSFSQAQNPFFELVSYRGAFAPAPAAMWTDSWTNWDPQNTIYGAGLPTVTITGNITANRTWTKDTVYILSGLVYVKNGAILTIRPGTIIKGDATVSNSSLVITKGSKINAVGTATEPIVFTSSKDSGSRNIGDWGGIIILGKSTVNKVGGVGNIEGIATSTDTEYGGGTSPDDNDNSGNLKYVRIEYGGYVFATDQEINGLTLGGVGRNTVIDYVQCSFINDDAFEWFGGTVNCSHLVAYRCLDDNFDTDNGFSGSVQFCLGVRDANISDQSAGSTSEGFESDNDATGSTNTPQTTCVFSNVTDISGFRGTTLSTWPSTFKFRRGARLRRNSGIKVLNSIMMDAPYGVFIDGSLCRSNLATGVTVFKNNIIAGSFLATEPGTASTLRDSLFSSTVFKNDSLVSTSGLLTSPYDYSNPDYRPVSSGLAVTKAADFSDAAFNNRKIIVTSASSIRDVTFRGAFAPAPAVMWTNNWTNWNPQSTVYPSATDTITGNITTNTTWVSSKTYCISGLVYINAGVTLTIQPGTVILGNSSIPNSSLVVTKGGMLNAIGTETQPIVFTSNKAAGSRGVGDWGGIILLGRASFNGVGGVGNIEGIAASTQTEYGGGASPNDNDNSGTIKYVRIEFGGYVFATDKEINGLTMGAVGRGTTIDYVQCSFINDDAFEWFGGTVNCAHLVAYRCLDDNFDTDNGFSGSVQFALGIKDPAISDQSASSTSEGFESDNDASGSTNAPQTRGLFTNVTEIGPFRGTVLSTWGTTFKFRRAARIRRNSGLRIFNSILMDYPYGVFVDGAAVRANLQSGATKFKNNLIAGCLYATEPGTLSTVIDSLFKTGTGFFKNDSLSSTSNVLVSPYDYFNPDYRPGSQPLATTGAAFTDSAFTGLLVPCDGVNTPGKISGNANIYGCSTLQSYMVAASSNASSYYWSVPAGVTIVSGQGTQTLQVNFPTTLSTGIISVVGKNDCGNTSAPSLISISKVVLGTPTAITSSPVRTNVCTLVGTDTTVTYSIRQVAGAVEYRWIRPSNTILVSGGTIADTAITIRFASGYTTSANGDTLRVDIYASTCQASKQAKLAIKAALPTAPASITATLVVNTCGNRVYRFSVPLVSGVSGYLWSLGTGTLCASAVVDSGSLSSRVVRIKFTSNAAASTLDSVFAKYVSNCGSTANKSLKITLGVILPPAAPASITATNIVTNVCGARRVRYFVPVTPAATTTSVAATGYEWSFSGSGLFSSTSNYVIDSGTVNSRIIVVTYFSNAAAAASDSISCRYNSDCGFGAKKSLKNALTALSAPVPASVTATNIVTNVCNGRRVRYTVPVAPAATTTTWAATGYEWSFAGSGLFSSSANYTIDSGTVNSQIIVVTYFSNAAAAANDSISCRYNSACGFGAKKSLKNALALLSAPAAPASITATNIVTTVCGGRTVRYTAPLAPAATTTAYAATGYEWSFAGSGLFLDTTKFTIDSGTINSRIIIVKFKSNAAAAANDSIACRYLTSCAPTANKKLKIALTALANCPVPRSEEAAALQLTSGIYPNPNNGKFTLAVNNTGIKERTVSRIMITDLLGKVVYQATGINENGKLLVEVNSPKLLSGVYLVRYQIGNIANTMKMVIVHN